MTDEEIKAKALEDDAVYDTLVEEYGMDYLREKQPDDILEYLDDENVKAACGDDAVNILSRAFHGYRYNPYNTESSEEFNPNDTYFFLNGYANMVSVQEEDKDEYLKNAINSKEDFVDWCLTEGYLTESDVTEVE
jgi:hypothetical protein